MIAVGLLFAGRLPLLVLDGIVKRGRAQKSVFRTVSVVFFLALYFLCILSLARGGFNPFIYFQF